MNISKMKKKRFKKFLKNLDKQLTYEQEIQLKKTKKVSI